MFDRPQSASLTLHPELHELVLQTTSYCSSGSHILLGNWKQKTGSSKKSSKDTCSFRIRWCQFAKLSSVHMSSYSSALSQSPWLLRQLKGLLELECNKRCLKVLILKRSIFYQQEAWCDLNTTDNPFHKITTESPSHRRTNLLQWFWWSKHYAHLPLCIFCINLTAFGSYLGHPQVSIPRLYH